MAGLYVHIPFCKSRCIYCGFYSTVGKENLQDIYTDTLIKELSSRTNYIGEDKISTIYFGGGTPSLLSHNNLARLTDAIYNINKVCVEEFTMECNPNDVTPKLCNTMKSIGVNRVSMGVQTFSNERLKFLGRRHKSEETYSAINLLRDNGIDNISIDLMFGFPGETISDWNDDITQAININADHISAYSLMYEEGTQLYQLLKDGNIKENDEEVSAEMYDTLITRLLANGYQHYEISNFCKSGKHSRHNSNYWNGTKYIGIGAAAHSYNGTSRQWNVSDLEEYINRIKNDKVAFELEELDENTRYNDLVTTALRTKNGIDLSVLSKKFHDYIINNARKSLGLGLMEIKDNHLKLTREGLYISDDVIADLIYV